MENKTKMKPIDRSKASNRRCVNCVHWKDSTPAKTGMAWDNHTQGIVVRDRICSETGEGVNYWNCCRRFEWDPEKEYTTPMPIAQPEIMSDAALSHLIGQPVCITAGRNRLYGTLVSTTAFDLMISDATLTDTIMGHELSWVIVGNMLIASHCLLRDLSFNDLDDIGLVEPQPIRLDGRDFIMRLPQVGQAPGLPNEWDSALNAAGDSDNTWHWSDMRCWGADKFTRIDGLRPVRGETARGWFYAGEDDWENNGWRPVLEPVAVEFNDDLIGKTISIWNGQEILDGQLVGYNDYDLCLICCMPWLYRETSTGRTWFTKIPTGQTLVDRAQVGIIQLREEKVIGNG